MSLILYAHKHITMELQNVDFNLIIEKKWHSHVASKRFQMESFRTAHSKLLQY